MLRLVREALDGAYKVLVPVAPESTWAAKSFDFLLHKVLAKVGFWSDMEGQPVDQSSGSTKTPQVVQALQCSQVLVHCGSALQDSKRSGAASRIEVAEAIEECDQKAAVME